MRVPRRVRLTALLFLPLVTAQSQAANADFQTFFFDVCDAPSGALADRCDDTPLSAGDLSGDSESSLNPTQSASHNQAPLAAAQLRSRQAADQAAADRAEERSTGQLAWLLHAFTSPFDRDVSTQQGAERGFDGDTTGIELGLDWRASDAWVVGALAGFETVDADFDAEAPGVNFLPGSTAGKTEADNRYLTVFASGRYGAGGYLDFAAGFEQSDGTHERRAVFQETTRVVAQTDVATRGEADGEVLWGSLGGGWEFTRDAWSFGPYAGVLIARAERDAYSESDLNGSGLNMSFGSTTRNSVLAHVGGQASHAISTSFGVLLPQLRAEYQRELDHDAEDLTAQFVLDGAGTVYAFAGDERDEEYATLGFSLSAVLANGWLPFFDASVVLGNDELDRQRFTLGVRKEF